MSDSIYTPLDLKQRVTRLVELMPGTATNEISCNFVSTSIHDGDEVVPYEALSYVWGVKEGKGPSIRLCDGSCEVTTNLFSALRSLRYTDHSRLLWIDAISINQGDVSEKNHQVRLMKYIYERAARVVIWLGEESRGTKEEVDFILRAASDRTVHWTPKTIYEAPGADVNTLLNVALLMNNPWWGRIWTLQEAVVAREKVFVIGRFVLPGDTFSLLAKSFIHHHPACCTDGPRFVSLLSIGRKMPEAIDLENVRAERTKLDFLRIASLYRQRDATDSRDKVYALLGLVEDIDENIIDYQLTLAQVYERIALEIIAKRNNLDVFSHTVLESRLSRENLELPSWVPDWSERDTMNHRNAIRRRHVQMSLFKAAGNSNVNLKLVSPGTLSIQGIIFDAVDKLGNCANLDPLVGDPAVYHEWRKMASLDSNPEAPYAGGGSWFNAYWRTLCLDSFKSTDTSGWVKAGHDEQVLHDAWWWVRLLQKYGQWKEQEGALLANATLFDHHLQGCAHYRRFLISEKGYIGLVPAATRAGDQICILLGGKMPFILRRQQQSENGVDNPAPKFSLVGDAYIHGLMDGEVMKKIEDGEHTLEDLILI